MKLERAQEYVTTTVAILVGMGLAYFLGSLSGSGQVGKVMVVLAALGFVAVLLALREHIWMLIPLSTLLTAQVEAVPGHLAIKEFVVVAVFAGIFALRAFKIIRGKPTYLAVDFWVFAILLYLLTCYVRNPVGGDALGSERVGGRPYLNVFTGFLAYWVLARMSLPVALARRAFYAVVTLNVAGNLLPVIAHYVPSTVPAIGKLVSVEDPDAPENINLEIVTGEGVNRQAVLGSFGQSIVQGLYSAFSPLSVLNPLNPVRFMLLVGAIVCILLSGFRSALVLSGMMFVTATYFRHGIASVFRFATVCIVGIVLLVVMQGTIINLPSSVQRTLSFLPGGWSEKAAGDANFSTEWRLYMWKQMLTTDRYIENKVLGDGFGMSSQQLQQSQSALQFGDPAQLQEHFMIVGQVHSGPISAIKYVGYVGLGIFSALLVTLSVSSWRLCRDTKGTPFFPLVLLTCVPMVTGPFTYVFIFGSFDLDLPNALLSTGMFKMLHRSFAQYLATQEAATATEAEPAVPEVALGRPVPAHLQH